MSKVDLVVKDNALSRSSYHLTLTEQRLLLLAIVNSRNSNTPITTDTELKIYAQEYASAFNCSLDNTYKALKTAAKTLFERQFSYQEYRNGKLGFFTSRWVHKVGYIPDDAYILIKLSSDIIPLVSELEKNFTAYNLSQIKDLTSCYSIRIYELIVSWKGTKKFKISLDDLRKTLQLTKEYERVYNLKTRVIDPSIKQINKNTDIKVEYSQIKRGRNIIAFEFNFSFKKTNSQKLSIEDWIQQNNLAHTGESWVKAKKRLKRAYFEYRNN